MSTQIASIPGQKKLEWSQGRKKLILTNLSKIYWPDDGLTKGDLLRYYECIAPYILPYLKNRPLSLKRNPNGIRDAGFYHKDAGDDAPAWMKVQPIQSGVEDKMIQYLVCNDLPSLLYIVNLGSIEINPWNSRISKLDKPDYMVIDLDPADENTFEQVIDAACVVRSIFKSANADCYCKTSGASGLHIYVPLGAKYTYDDVKEFGRLVANKVVSEIPDFTTTQRPLAKRKGRMYIDFLQNRQGQTLASVYSLRPKNGAPVSTPLDWKEVKKGLHPLQFTMRNILKRLEKKGDLFKPVLGTGINMTAALKKI